MIDAHLHLQQFQARVFELERGVWLLVKLIMENQ